MKRFSERNPRVIAAISAVVIVAAILVSLNFSKLSLFAHRSDYHAQLATVVGLDTGDEVTVAGVSEGRITSMSLDGTVVNVTFTLNDAIALGTTTSAQSKVLTPIGEEYLALSPSGPGRIPAGGTIPLSRTSVPSTLVSDLNTLGTQTEQLNIGQLAKALDVTSQTFAGVSPNELNAALSTLSQLSQNVGSRQGELATFVSQADALSTVLASHTTQLTSLIGQSNLVLQVLDQRRQAINELLSTTATLSQQLNGIFDGRQSELTSLISNLNTVSAALASDNNAVGQALPLLAAFSRYGANAAGSGPFVDTEIPTFLIPDNQLAACAAAAHAASFNPVVGCRS
jgi:phospholipid/cholesterol/gamma-HCH transport system substrate-binding protein